MRHLVFGWIIVAGACGNVQSQSGDAAAADAATTDGATPDVAIDTNAVMRTVSVVLSGNGTVTSNLGGINCPSRCSTVVADGAQITITAAAQGGSTFLGWIGGTCSGTTPCTFTVVGDTAINASFGLDLSVVVTRTGDGSGVVTSNPSGINCGTDCDEVYASGTMVTLTATPAVSSRFSGWTGGGCSGTDACTVTLTAAVAVNADFALRRQTLMTMLSGSGSGSVSSSSPGISCAPDCSEVYNYGTVVALTATADATSRFAGWAGACSGTGPCMITMDADRSVTATFTRQFTLTVSRAGSGAGTVSSSPGGINCGSDCTEGYDSGTMITLTANPANGSSFSGWSGGGCSGPAPCRLAVTGDTAVTASFSGNGGPPPPNIVFVTSTVINGNMGGIAGADNLCQARAQAGGLTGTYRAFLGTSAATAISRLGASSGWVRPDGKPVVNTTSDLASGKTFYPIRLDELGTDVLEQVVYTGHLINNIVTTCNNYTVADNQMVGTGNSAGVSDTSIGGFTISCSSPGRLYCFGIDNTASVTIVPAAAFRRAFGTNAFFAPGGGIASADALCASEASSAGLPGTYKALLATTTASAASRFSTTGLPWGRIDGILLTQTAGALFSSAFWDSAITTSASGEDIANFAFWSGATSMTAPGTAALTCSNWTSTPGNGRAGLTAMTSARSFSFFANPCNASSKLICLQQ